MLKQIHIVGVIGAGKATQAGRENAFRVGQLLAEAGVMLVCGGLGGIMEAAAKGCRLAGGIVIGVLPGDSAAAANPYVTIPIVTDMGQARNVIIAHTAQVLIAIEGEYGTLSEIALGLKLNKPVIQLGSWPQISTTHRADNPDQAVEFALTVLRKGR